MKMRVAFTSSFSTIKELKEALDEFPVELEDEDIEVRRDPDYYDTWLLSVTVSPASIDAIECGNHYIVRDENGKIIPGPKDIIVNLHECSAD